MNSSSPWQRLKAANGRSPFSWASANSTASKAPSKKRPVTSKSTCVLAQKNRKSNIVLIERLLVCDKKEGGLAIAIDARANSVLPLA